jgi:hypothetical protein
LENGLRVLFVTDAFNTNMIVDNYSGRDNILFSPFSTGLGADQQNADDQSSFNRRETQVVEDSGLFEGAHLRQRAPVCPKTKEVRHDPIKKETPPGWVAHRRGKQL